MRICNYYLWKYCLFSLQFSKFLLTYSNHHWENETSPQSSPSETWMRVSCGCLDDYTIFVTRFFLERTCASEFPLQMIKLTNFICIFILFNVNVITREIWVIFITNLIKMYLIHHESLLSELNNKLGNLFSLHFPALQTYFSRIHYHIDWTINDSLQDILYKIHIQIF